MQIGIKLKQLRQHQQLTQADVADELKLSRKTISSWENDRSYPDVASLITLSDIYHVTVDELLKGDQSMINHLVEIDRQAKRTRRARGYYYWFNLIFLLANITCYVLTFKIQVPNWIQNVALVGWIVTVITMLVSLSENYESVKTKTVVSAVIIFVFMMVFLDPFVFPEITVPNMPHINVEAYHIGVILRQLTTAIFFNLSVILAILARPSYLRFGRHD
ncbi:helix-turn-helix domain-containing protein [Furfurilactobacillus milii]|uniref:Helix-turn-helix domain-containing protein n=1 Tax=Furfurilactobacillus rossiae TaxID=231049 RepID=A0A7C9IZS3_9LACO|nr:helix-turn-helix domain-containing protein [Furfurilactobacillus milii]MYV06102.1 helix-turn-helix domain-containing protein [Furfurilactobacillus milii]